MEGFLAYRARTEVDFADVDLFVLSGPTGAGKSSVIDAMIFALYGTIPRLADGRAVAPIISARADRARVAFDFTVGDMGYTAVRLVQRTRSGGATTAEARLERESGEVLAGNAAELTAKVEGLLGLTYDHFTKAVVLPQGDFAAFLSDTPRDRQALLRALLDIDLFAQVMQLANDRAREAGGRLQATEQNLARLVVPTVEQVDQARSRLEVLLEAEATLPARAEEILALETALVAVRERHAALSAAVARLEAISVPEHLETLQSDRAMARELAAGLDDELAKLHMAGKSLDEQMAGHPPLARLEGWLADRAKLADLDVQKALLDLETLAEAVAKTTAARKAARVSYERLRVEHSAHELRAHLASGDTCPVCQSVIATLPEADGPDPLEGLAGELRAAELAVDAARDAMKEAEGRGGQIGQQIEALEAHLAEVAQKEAVEAEIVVVRALEQESSANREAQLKVRGESDLAREQLTELEQRGSALRESMLTAWGSVADEEPPVPGDDVVESWRRFGAWRDEKLSTRIAERAGLGEDLDDAARAVGEAQESLRGWLSQLGIEAKGSPERDLALAVARARAELSDFERTIATAAELESEIEVDKAKVRVASSLATYLRANNFEAWLLEEALESLVEGANLLLDDLSAGAYSLQARDRAFQVIDHRNADLARTTRSLSGGETFLVSLSLALSMADQLAELTGTSSRLESVLLDEGFGSLDQESLDVVAAVLDELVGRGRTVGLVTHVRELAERIPVRFEVTKGPDSSSIIRVPA
jgi:exonuclease SbcC